MVTGRFDRVFWRRLWALGRPMWVSDQKWTPLGLLAGSLLLTGSVKCGSIVMSYVNRDMMTALTGGQAPVFFHNVMLIVAYSLVAAPITAIDGYVQGRLMIYWRQWLTERFLDHGFHDRIFYRISSDPSIDNPDQRISEDLNAFPGLALSFVLQVLWGIVTGASFLVVLWLISPSLVAILGLCIGVGSLLTVLIGRPLIGINFMQRRREADFRHSLVRLRDNAEAIALYAGERREERELVRRLYAVIQNSTLMVRWQRNVAFLTYSYDLLLALVPVVALAPSYFAGEIAFGQITQASAAFLTLRTALSIIVDQFNSLSSFAAVVERLGSYLEAGGVRRPLLVAEVASSPPAASRIETVESARVSCEALTIQTPDARKTLLRDLTFAVDVGERLLIVGESGVGKTSLLRAIAGLWRTGSGRVLRPPLPSIMFLPQRPYMVLGSLREQLCYPRAADVGDEELVSVLQRVGLADLPSQVGGLDAAPKWKDLLSLGEQQKVAFARLLLDRPDCAFLDEATSALDPASETLLLQQLAATGMTVVSVRTRVELLELHDVLLELLGDGAWRLSRAGSAPLELGRARSTPKAASDP
ncbi:ABC transporter ATP-binding protein/permease [Candidatus Binatia bacterium]|nr:ABC transporter ATP-binding protein/permease [Candidatus Binatia bacterium]